MASILGACSLAPTHDSGVKKDATVSLEAANQQPSFYLKKTKQRQSLEQQNRYMLLGVHAYLNDGDYPNADLLLRQLKNQLVNNDEVQAQYLYLSAVSLTLQGKDAEAIAVLNYPENWRLKQWQWKSYYQLKAKLYKKVNHPIEYVKQLSKLSQYYPFAQRAEINDKIWHELQALPTDIVALYTQEKNAPIFSGWMQLAYIVKHYAISPSELIRYLSQWQKQNPNHPAAEQLPSELEKALNTQPYRPQQIAVLLPMSGPKAEIANPIEQGILSSYFHGSNKDLQIKFYDSAIDVVQAYEKAINDGAEFVIGPLLPSNLNKILQYQNETGQIIPQLFLNKAEKFTSSDSQYYFSLSPQEEASDAASKLFNDNVKHPLLLVSSDATGRRMADSFNETWVKLTGEKAEVHFYQSGDRMKLAVQQAMGVKDSLERINKIKKLLGDDIKADFRSRRDIDAIYMIAGPRDLSLLKPFIDVNFSVFAEPVPLYTSSRGRLARNTGKNALELNNITISDIPWLMKPSLENQQIAKLWPNWNNSQKRLFAMGYDSYQLIERLAQMRAFSGYQFKGRTGNLIVQPNGVINRHLTWGKYTKGKLIAQ